MDFNIRAISVAESIKPDVEAQVAELAGKKIEFRSGISVAITLPDDLSAFDAVPDPKQLLTVLDGWCRLYRFPEQDWDAISVLAPAERQDGDLEFRRVDFRQQRVRKGPRPPVTIVSGEVMDFDECVSWLIDLSEDFDSNPDDKKHQLVLARPRWPKSRQNRIAWIGPSVIDNESVVKRLSAIGTVYGVEVVPVQPQSYKYVRAQLAGQTDLSSVVICERYAPFIGADAVPKCVSQDLIHLCKSDSIPDLETELRAWIELAEEFVAKTRTETSLDDEELLLVIMFRGMLSHSKIGPFNHCPKDTVLKNVRARHLNAAMAEDLLDANSESFQDTRVSEKLFLHKEHNDGRQYFLNPKKVDEIKARVEAATGASTVPRPVS